MIQLMIFRDGNVGAAPGDDGDDLLRVSTTEGKTMDEEPITRNDRFGLTCLRVNRGDAPPLLRLVVDIVVNQRRRVNQFKRQCKGHDILNVGPASQLVSQQEQNWAQSLSTRIENATCLHGHFPSTRCDFVLNEVQQGLIDFFSHGFQR